MTSEPRIVVAGAGHIGCFVGALLAAAGRRVTLLARPAMAAEIDAAGGLRITDLDGLDIRAENSAMTVTTDPAEALTGADVVLVTVKSGATAAIAADIASHAPAGAVVVSLQNGVNSAVVLADALPNFDVRAGMVLFNVVHQDPGHFHRAIAGGIIIGDGPGAIEALLTVPGLAVTASPDIVAIQWGKLLFNLNNAVFALSGGTILEHFEDRDWRRLMADQLDEALRAMKAAGIRPQPPISAPAWVLPTILRLPTFLFRRVAARLLSVDPTARPSMWYDLDARRLTEVDDLQGTIEELAVQHGQSAPICAKVRRLIHQAEAQAQGSPGLSLSQLRP